jgi:acyl-CoA synthetase (AMP-forming)/AMP-acid ligase II
VRMRAQRSADQVAFVWHPYHGSPREWTYRQLARSAAGLAAGLQSRGIGAGDRVLIHLENCPEFVIAWYACAAIGAVAVTTGEERHVDGGQAVSGQRNLLAAKIRLSAVTTAPARAARRSVRLAAPA